MYRSLRRSRAHLHSGFTLIELLVVIAILGILAGVVVFSVRGIGDKGEGAALAIDARTLRTAQEAYRAQFGTYGSEKDLVDEGFLQDESKLHDVDYRPEEGGPGSYAIAVRGGTLVVGESFRSNAITNVASSTGGGTHAWWEVMYNGLLSLDEQGNPSPELAVEVPTVANGGITNGGATYTLKLRPGVKFHDGGAFTADDVKFTFEKVLLRYHARAANMAGPLGYLSATCRANNIVVLDPLTVQFNFTAPYIPFLKQLNVTEAGMNPASALPAFPPGVDGCPTQAQADAIKVGTGPFEFDSINQPQADDGKVVRNPDYWRPGLPYLDAILMRPYTDETARYNALVNGEVDFVWDVALPKVAELDANSAFRIGATQALGGGPNSIDTVIFNLKASGSSTASVADGTAPPHPVLGDVDVRRAIFHALDRQEFLTSGRHGIGKVAVAPVSSEIFGHAPDLTLPPFDVNAANTLLGAAGWNGPRQTVNGTPNVRTASGHPTLADGTPLSIRFLQGSPLFNDRIAVVKSNLAAVGIDLVVTVNTTNANTVVFTNRNFDLYIINYAHGFDPHIGVRRQYHTDQIKTTGLPNNAAGYRNGLVDSAFDSAAQTLDTGVRFDLYHDFQEQVVQDLPYAWMIETPNVRGWAARCQGIKTYELFAERASCQPK